MTDIRTNERPGRMTAERGQTITDLFRATHPSAAAEIADFVDSIIHGLGDDVTALDERIQGAAGATGPVSILAAQAAVEFIMAAMLAASR